MEVKIMRDVAAFNQTIPVVDLREWTGGTAAQKAQAAQTIGDALFDVGFFSVVAHGVDQKLIAQAYDQVAHLFDLPLATKSRYEIAALKGQRGYTSFGREHAKDHKAPDLKEFWHVGQELPGGHRFESLYGHNVWPEELAQFRPVMLQLFMQLEQCAHRLLEACAMYLDEPEGLFCNMTRDGDTILRLINYPPVPPDAHPASIRAAPHEDINFITLLCEATASGLELLQRDGVWRPIHTLQGQIIVDAGDMLQHLTNGLFKSTTHRVVNPNNSRERRFSMPFFVHPRGEVDLTPMPACVSKTGGQVQYPERTARQFLDQRLREIGLADTK